MKLVQKLPGGPLDIVGDIHGEYFALKNLLRNLGYDEEGQHKNSRKLVFVGDYCDRGPDSPAVIRLIEKLVSNGNATAILGNHEINLLRGDAKGGSGWFFDERLESDKQRYKKFNTASNTEKQEIISFLNNLPIALERNDLRVIHAAWIDEFINDIRDFSADQLLELYEKYEAASNLLAEPARLKMQDEIESWPHALDDAEFEPPLLVAHADYAIIKQMGNPIKVLTAGVERRGTEVFFSNGRWRFADRIRWWDDYNGQVPVVVGHYWRKLKQTASIKKEKSDPDMFKVDSATSWHGKNNNVFCIDYSVGGRSSIKNEQQGTHLKLAALRWPENILMFDDGISMKTEGYL